MNSKIEELGLKEGSRVLVIFPHPDDETFSSAGFIQKTVKIGCSLRVVILTKGEASTLRFGLQDSDDLAQARTKEFENVCKILGVKDYRIGGFGDGKIEESFSDVCGYIKAEIASYKPDIVLTYEPSGIYGHPDHIAVSKAVSRIHSEEHELFKLLYATVSDSFHPSEDSLKMAKDPNLVKPIPPNVMLRLSIKETFKKIQALKANKSQFKTEKGSLSKMLKMEFLFREYLYLV